MGRVLGKIEDGMGQIQYFIHCDTVGRSFRPLFNTPDEAWAAYDAAESPGLYAAVPAKSKTIRVVTKTLANGRFFGKDSLGERDIDYGIATEDRLICPLQLFDENALTLMQIQGVLHLARYIDAAFMGGFYSPICNAAYQYSEKDEVVGLVDFHGKPINVCPCCIEQACRHS